MKTQFFNGDDLWHPHEGLLATVELMKEAKIGIETGQIDVSVLGPDVPSALALMINDTNRLAQMIETPLTHAIMLHNGKTTQPIRVEFPEVAKARLENIQWFVSDASQWNKSGKFPLSGVTLNLPGRYYEFSPDGRFAFAARSIEQCLAMTQKGFFEVPANAYVPIKPDNLSRP